MGVPAAVGHLDADCFYISAERVRNTFLLGKPVGVLGNQGAFVIAKSYEMKAAGVKTGDPIWEAIVKCPHGVYLKRDFRWYEVLSRLMLDVVREFSPEVEYYSIDEFFFRVPSDSERSLQETAEVMRHRILQQVRVPVTVGIARSKTLAKLISDQAKPFGALALVDPEAERALLDRTAVQEICGIGERRAKRLAEYKVFTALDLALANRKLIRSLLTAVGEALWFELNGDPVLPLYSQRPPHKMLSRGGAIGKPSADFNYIWGWLVRSLERLIEELEYHRVCAGRLETWVMHYDGQVGVGKVELNGPTDRFDLLLEAARLGLRRAWLPRRTVARLNLVATHLQWPGSVQRGLFDPPAERAETLARLKREVNDRCGRFALRSGATLFVNEFYKDEAYSYEVCDVRGKICF
ncbi:MAG: nucleotidyltransferase [Planctomycetes bacterium]|nr:nucleotidyltransferase [Planctomycetota bacterium]